MTPKRTAAAIEAYLKSLYKQAKAAEAFYYGRIREGIQGLSSLPKDVRLKIDRLLWDASRGYLIDPTDPLSAQRMVEAILFSLEERMGMHTP